MNFTDKLIIEEYRREKQSFLKIGDIVRQKLTELCEKAGVSVMAIEHRVKGEKSLAGKLARAADRYHALSDLTDILGARIICFFEDEVDIIGKLVEQAFDVDWENCSDKRALIKADTFGYLSLHYICLLKESDGYPKELLGKPFEIQIRTNLQHTWSAIYHDLGYKSKFGVPREITREFARVAGLLEIADKEFVRVRNNMNAYTADICQKIKEDMADEVSINRISLSEYIKSNRSMREFLAKLAGFSGAEIEEVDAEIYIEQLMWLKKDTLGDLRVMLEENQALALRMAERILKDSELDIISSSVGLYYLCRAELVNKNYSVEQAAEFIKLSTGNKDRAERQAKRLMANWVK